MSLVRIWQIGRAVIAMNDDGARRCCGQIAPDPRTLCKIGPEPIPFRHEVAVRCPDNLSILSSAGRRSGKNIEPIAARCGQTLAVDFAILAVESLALRGAITAAEICASRTGANIGLQDFADEKFDAETSVTKRLGKDIFECIVQCVSKIEILGIPASGQLRMVWAILRGAYRQNAAKTEGQRGQRAVSSHVLRLYPAPFVQAQMKNVTAIQCLY